MSGCCEAPKFDGVSESYKRALIAVIAINFSMFIVEVVAGVSAQSKALEADALDFLGDSLTYALRLWAIGKAVQLRTNVALIKGSSLCLMAMWVLGSSVYRFFVTVTPEPLVMGSVGLLALAANVTSVLILIRFRDGDSNVRSVWLCSRNDAIGNVAVVIAAAGVWGVNQAWPDLVVALLMASLFFYSAVQIINQALAEKRASQPEIVASELLE